MKALSGNSYLARLLGGLTQVICRHPRWFVLPQIALLILCVIYTVANLQFDTNRDDLVGSEKKYHQNFLQFKKEFPLQDDLVVVAESEDVEKNRQFVERLSAKLSIETNLFRDIFYQKDLAMMGNKALLFASEDDLTGLKEMLRADMPFIKKFTGTTNLISLFEQINTAFRTAPRETNAETSSLVQALPALERIISQATESLRRPGTPLSPGVTALFNTNLSYITFAGGRIFVLTAHAPTESANENSPTLWNLLKNAVLENVFHRRTMTGDLNADAVKRLRELVAETQVEVPGLNVGVTGEPVIELDEMAQSQKDTTLASIVSLILCAVIFIYGYNELGRPLKATICLVFGLVYTLAFATLVVGHLNILTITFVPILIGLAIDFGVHLVTRYEEELRHGKTRRQALKKAMMFTGQGIFVGALTTAGAFLAMALTDFKGIQEMGIICGGGLMVCLVPMLTLLPVLLLRGRQNAMDREMGQIDRRARIENFWLQRPIMVAIVTASICAAAVIQFRKVYFDYNLLNMQSPGLPAVVFAHKLIDADKSILSAAVVADSIDEAVALEKKLQPLTNTVISQIYSMAGFIHENQIEKMKLISEIKNEVAPLQFASLDTESADLSALSLTLYGFNGYVGNAIQVTLNDAPELAKQFTSLHLAVDELRRTMLAGSAAERVEHAVKLGEYQQALFSDIRTTFQMLQQQNDTAPLTVADLPRALRDRFVGINGKFLLQVFPKKDAWQRENQKEFIGQLREALDPKNTNHPVITGTPVQLYEYETLLKNSYVQAAWYSLVAIGFMVLFHFRSLSAVIFALLPVGIGTLWLAGLMGTFNIPFNLANIMTLPLVIGIGVTNGIHILNRFAEERTPSILSRSTGKAVLVSGLTAIAGFGSLILAKHRGIHSLGCVMSVGIATCMIAGLTFLPALLNLIGKWRPLIKQPSADKLPTLGQEEQPR